MRSTTAETLLQCMTSRELTYPTFFRMTPIRHHAVPRWLTDLDGDDGGANGQAELSDSNVIFRSPSFSFHDLHIILLERHRSHRTAECLKYYVYVESQERVRAPWDGKALILGVL